MRNRLFLYFLIITLFIIGLNSVFLQKTEAQLPSVPLPTVILPTLPPVNLFNPSGTPQPTQPTQQPGGASGGNSTTTNIYNTTEEQNSSNIQQPQISTTTNTTPPALIQKKGLLTLNRRNTASNRIVLTKDIDEVVFGLGSLSPNKPPLIIVMPSQRDMPVRFNFEAFLQDFTDGHQHIVLPQAIRMEQTIENESASVLLPENVDMSTPDCETSWDGTFTALTILSPSEVTYFGKHIGLPIEIGRNECKMQLSIPATIVFDNNAEWQVGFRPQNKENITEITAFCPTENEKECTTNEAKDLVVKTYHFTQFITFKEGTLWDAITALFRGSSLSTIIIAAFLTLLLAFILSNLTVLRKVGAIAKNNQDQKDYLSVASHELRTPMTAIKWLISMILHGDYGRLNNKLKTSLEKVSDSTEHSLHMVNDILDVSRLESGKTPLSLTSFSIDTVITTIVDTLKPIAKEKKLTLEAHELEPIAVLADKDKVQQILTNLVGNALKCTDTGGVDIALKKLKNHVVISVHDTGVGIAENEREKLFKKFEKLSNMEGKKVPSSGLGLYISRQFARKMGGDVELVESKPGAGSTFALVLPLTTEKK